MDRPTALRISGLALAAGVAADVLVRGHALGLNFLIETLLILGAGTIVAGDAARRRVDRWDLWLLPCAAAFAAFVAVRADPALVTVDVLIAVASASAWLAALGGARVTRGSLRMVAFVAAVLCASAVAGGASALHAARPLTAWLVRPAALSRTAIPVLRGVVIVLPLLLVFAGLFAAADAVFATGLETLFRIDLDLDLAWVADRTIVIVAVAWVVAGLLVVAAGEWGSLVDPDDDPRRELAGRSLGAAVARPSALRLGEVEASVILVAIDLLFAVFVLLQVAYLFGGRDTLAATGVTYADYARRGFFELLTVAALAGSVVAALEATVARRTRVYLVSALALVALTLVVVGSSLLRLRLYQEAYGWTELRFWVLLSIGWVACSLLALAVLVVRDRSRWVLHVLGILGLVTVGLANVIGPQAFVADRNLERALNPSLVPTGGHTGLDSLYLSQLGDDTIPAVVAAYPRLLPQDQAWLEPVLAARRVALERDPRYTGWPSWNLARVRALDALTPG